MLTISKPLSASQAQTYHVREFAAQEQNYWSRDQQGHSEWQGRLAEQWGLQGSVGSEHFARLSEGQHPHTEEQLVRHQVARTYEGKFGREVISTEHHLAGALVAVRDSGLGIDPEHREQIFKSFYTTKPNGTGMGLSICRSIIDAHGGRLWAEANEPRGTIFQFTLPAASRD